MNTTLTFEEIRHNCRLLYHLTQIPVFCMEQNRLLFVYPDLEGMEQLCRSLSEALPVSSEAEAQPKLYTDNPSFLCGRISLESGEGHYHLLAGPCLLGQLSHRELSDVFPDLKALKPKTIFLLLSALPVKRPEYLCDMLALSCSLFSQASVSSAALLKNNHGEPPLSVPAAAQDAFFHHMEVSQFHTPYSYEKKMLEAVRTGAIHQIQESLYDLNTVGKAGLLSDKPLRNSQDLFIAHITQVTRAAIEGGVSESKAFAMSDSYIRACEKCTTVTAVTALRDQSAYEFTTAVARARQHRGTSPAIRNAVNYLISHQYEKITLRDVAQNAGLSPSRLSHLFRQELGIPPMEYLNRERIETAKNMLTTFRYSTSEISMILSFSSQSHFISVFKKYTGMTPGQYKNRL